VPTQGELEIHFIDVGQGDSILIDLGETEVLIDGGEKSPGVVDFLKKYVDGPLEVMVATHPHSDHIGGLIAVLSTFQVQQIWYNGENGGSATYNEFVAAVQAEVADVHVGKRGEQTHQAGAVSDLFRLHYR
jgi:beta-lactamase superfamily II metal-dependent hydrolase